MADARSGLDMLEREGLSAALLAVNVLMAMNPPGTDGRWRKHSSEYHKERLARHLYRHDDGEEYDPDTGCPQLANVAARSLMALAKWLEEEDEARTRLEDRNGLRCIKGGSDV